MMFEHCASFVAGDDVPAWLIDTEPRQAGATRPRLTFQCACHVVELDAGYFLVSENTDVRPILADGGSHSNIAASARTVILPTAFMILGAPNGKV